MSELLQWATPTVMLALAGFGWKLDELQPAPAAPLAVRQP